nr:M20/M25/M40 family metallo-hydrolase [Candidatus Sigynarchaeota archaeon]
MGGNNFSMMGFIKDVCENIGPRFGTSKQEQAAGEKIKGIMEGMVSEVKEEEFQCAPKAFLDFLRVLLLALVVGTIVFPWLPLLTAVLFVYAITLYIFEQAVLKEYADFLFPKGTGRNIIGKLKPTGTAKTIVICSAHHDSAFEFPLFAKYKAKFGLVAYSTLGILVAGIAAGIIEFILPLLGITSVLITVILFVPLVVAIVLGIYFNMYLHSGTLIQGANDNLSGVAVVLALAEHFSKKPLKNVELWFISFSCEECMRGAKRFVDRHAAELKDARVVNFDQVGRAILTISSGESSLFTLHSAELAAEFQESSKHAGSELPINKQDFGGTDAVHFSRAGIKAITIIGLSDQHYPDPWHEVIDTPAIVEQGHLDKTLAIATRYLEDLDGRN